MKKIVWGLATVSVIGVGVHFATLPPPPPDVPPVPAKIPVPEVPALTPYDMPTGQVPVSTEPYRSTNRSVSIQDLVDRKLTTGIYTGTPYWKERAEWFDAHFYDTLAARKVWNKGTSPDTHKRGGPVTWTYQPIPQYVPPPCTEVQPTGYDAEGCRYVLGLFKDVEAKDPIKANKMREQARRGRDNRVSRRSGGGCAAAGRTAHPVIHSHTGGIDRDGAAFAAHVDAHVQTDVFITHTHVTRRR